MPTQDQLQVENLGERTIPSPLNLSTIPNDEIADYVPDDARVLLHIERSGAQVWDTAASFEKAGPRQKMYFDPATTKAGIVTCGGLCPGLNNVIRAIVLQLFYKYGVRKIVGFRFGYHGLAANPKHPPMTLGPDEVRIIHHEGGSVLGMARGGPSVAEMADTIERHDLQILFAIGGDGTLRGAKAIHEELKRRGRKVAVVGVPKTIDNDVAYVDKTFGFDTAVEVARMALNGAHTEAVSADYGVGLVKLMGRDSGFIAAAATLASLEVNYCLVPEIHFDLQGEQGLLRDLEKRLEARGHALIVVAEGCARRFAAADQLERDVAGNVDYGKSDIDAGAYLRDAIGAHFKKLGRPVTLKYIDPSYMIRSVPANANDSVFCDVLARHAVHAAMAGKTGLVIGRWHNVFTHVPLAVATSERKVIDTDSGLWLAVTETTGQPDLSNVPVSRRADQWKTKR